MSGQPTTQPRVPGDVLVHLRRARDRADRDYAEPLLLDQLAAEAGLSKFHFLRLFRAAYGVTPGEYVSQRRVERAQDLLRATNLTVTEVCHAVGFTSLGSFSARFRALVGESPSAFQQRWAATGAPHIPGCYVFMWGLAERVDAGAQGAPRQDAPAAPRQDAPAAARQDARGSAIGEKRGHTGST
ncbi:MAG TPA: helix-turn-helix transcriptional regulator [Dermatophilaceae bacterium]|nr:helix-turn-helix transcriptional regulator [Dermatophilaceae bacterium]